MTALYRKLSLFIFLISVSFPLSGQFTASGTDPAKVKWSYIETTNYKIIYPRGLDSLAFEYANSLEKYSAVLGNTCGYFPNEKYRKPMPVVLHPYNSYSNGFVSWAPRSMNLFTTPEAYDPESTPWMDQLAVHEGRHVAQMQFVRGDRFFRGMEGIIGELWAGAASAIWPGPVFFEGDAVVAETALTKGGRGRSAQFLEYYRVSFADSLYRNFWQWRYSSQKRYTPDYYRVGYMLFAGMRTTFDEPQFTNYYYSRLFGKKLYPFYNLQKSVKEVSGLKFKDAFRKIEEDFGAEWAANDSLRVPETFGKRVTAEPRLYHQFSSIRPAENGLYATRRGLSLPEELVFVGYGGKIKRLSAFSSLHSRLSGDYKNGLYWTEYRANSRWELSSTSVLRSYNGTKITLAKGERYYNPVRIGDSISLTSYLPSGEMGIAVLDAKTASKKAFFRSPDGLQPVESVINNKELYASGISSDGFGIYRLPDWECVLGPSNVMIKGLFEKDGALWFTCDLSGVDELYSFDVSSGTLLQRTSTKFGADDFCFTDGKMYFTQPGVKDKAIYCIPEDSLLSRKVVFEPLPRPRADKLSAQEIMKPQEDFVAQTSGPKNYSKSANLFKFHSWAPLYVEYDITRTMAYELTSMPALPGVSFWFQNDLSTSYGQVGISYGPHINAENKIIWRPAAHAQWVYTGLLPVLEVKADFNPRSAVYNNFNIEKTPENRIVATSVTQILEKPYFELALGSYLPLSFSSGGWRRGIIPSFFLTINNDEFRLITEENIRISQHFEYKSNMGLFTNIGLKAYTMLPTPSSCIFPRWGIGGEMVFMDYPLMRQTYGKVAAGGLYTYVPGILRTHGLRLAASASMNYGNDWNRTFKYSASAEYAMPFLALDWSGLSPWFYVRNFELRGYFSVDNTIVQPRFGGEISTAPQAYFGASLAVHLGNFLWVPYDTLLGIKYLYNPINEALSGVSLIFSVDL